MQKLLEGEPATAMPCMHASTADSPPLKTLLKTPSTFCCFEGSGSLPDCDLIGLARTRRHVCCFKNGRLLHCSVSDVEACMKNLTWSILGQKVGGNDKFPAVSAATFSRCKHSRKHQALSLLLVSVCRSDP